MASHKVVRGETSTYKGNGGKESFPTYDGKHRKEDKGTERGNDGKGKK